MNVSSKELIYYRGRLNLLIRAASLVFAWCIMLPKQLFMLQKAAIPARMFKSCPFMSNINMKLPSQIVFHGDGRPGRTYVLGTQSQDDLEAWMKLLACASYDYVRNCLSQFSPPNFSKKFCPERYNEECLLFLADEAHGGGAAASIGR